jgi:hypothetical protein
MGFTKTTQTVTTSFFTPTAGGFWFVERESTGELFKVIFHPEGRGAIPSIRQSFGFSTFSDLLDAMLGNNIPLPKIETPQPNVEGQADVAGVLPQFDDITNAQLLDAANAYGAKEFCIAIGAFAFVQRYYHEGMLTIQELAEIFNNYLDNNRIPQEKIETAIDWLVAQGDITQAQADQFWQNRSV